MKRADFVDFCASKNIVTTDAGNDWHSAGVEGAYICAIIRDQDDLRAINPLLDSGAAYLASCARRLGNDWVEFCGQGKLNADDAPVDLAQQYSDFLSGEQNIEFFSAADIKERTRLLAANPPLMDEDGDAAEDGDDHYVRVRDTIAYIAPLHVDEPGYWDEFNLLLSADELRAGIWSFGHDSQEQLIVLILNEGSDETKQ